MAAHKASQVAANKEDLGEKLALQVASTDPKILRCGFYELRPRRVPPPCPTQPNGQRDIVRKDFDDRLNSPLPHQAGGPR